VASSVDVVSALGHGLVASQVGPSAGYDAIDDRRFWSVGLQEGAISAGSYEVTQRAAGANLTVDVAASTGDGALVQGDSVTGQGLYRVAPHTAAINVDIAAANATNPRVDIVILEVKDDAHDVGGLNVARVRVISGTATSGATLENRTGAAALPSSAMLLADVLVPATDTTISNSQIRDRRSWARGGFARLTYTAGALTTTSATYATVHATLQGRIECTGVPVRMTIGSLRPMMDAAVIDSATDPFINTFHVGAVVDLDILSVEHTFTPTAGSHTFEWYWATNAATLTMNADAASPIVVTIEELVRQNTVNNATTSG
jgi:hypothetical protein